MPTRVSLRAPSPLSFVAMRRPNHHAPRTAATNTNTNSKRRAGGGMNGGGGSTGVLPMASRLPLVADGSKSMSKSIGNLHLAEAGGLLDDDGGAATGWGRGVHHRGIAGALGGGHVSSEAAGRAIAGSGLWKQTRSCDVRGHFTISIIVPRITNLFPNHK